MGKNYRRFLLAFCLAASCLPFVVSAQKQDDKTASPPSAKQSADQTANDKNQNANNQDQNADDKKQAADNKPVLWMQPTDIGTRDLFYGAGGKDNQPQGKLTFVEEDMSGSNPKIVVKDEAGARWKVKLGVEAQPEVAAARLLWAIGYYSVINYYLPEARIENLPKLKRGEKFVSKDRTTIQGARFELVEKGGKKEGNWSWYDNPFVGSREFNGLRVMMAFINNWDLKEINNDIRDVKGVGRVYFVKDLGAAFGRTGSSMNRSKSVPDDYLRSKFIDRVEGDRISFVMDSRPFFLMAVNAPYYADRTKMEKITKDIPRADAKWLGDLLGQLNAVQISEAFRAAGYAQDDISKYTAKVRERTAELQGL